MEADPTARRRAPRRSAAALLVAALSAATLVPAASSAAAATTSGAASSVATGTTRFVGQVTDALRTPTHRLSVGANGRATADLVFVDHDRAKSAYHTCVQRSKPRLAICFDAVSGPPDVANVTPLRFGVGSYRVTWMVAGAVVAHWRFSVT
ncbi:MAG: hypothetical protein JWQ48_295 [Conexibacter sp.]|nr:hypothetical protein [Conexibacter sp.]